MDAIQKTKSNLLSMRFYSPFELLSAITKVTGGTKTSSFRWRRADHLIFDEYSSPISKYSLSTEAKRNPSLVSCLVLNVLYYITTLMDLRVRSDLRSAVSGLFAFNLIRLILLLIRFMSETQIKKIC